MGDRELTPADLIALELFVDSVDLGSLSADARRHRARQPAASESLRRLERRLDVTLLVQGPRGSHPTAEGGRLATSARELLAAVARFVDHSEAVRAGARRQIRVAAS